MTSFDRFLEEQLDDPALRMEYDALESEFEHIQAMIDAGRSAETAPNQLDKKKITESDEMRNRS